MMNPIVIRSLSAIALLTASLFAQAQTITLPTTEVRRVLVTGDSLWGGCMAALGVNPNSYAGNCANNWVSFSCSGHFADKDLAFRMLDQAQLALALNKPVVVHIDPNKLHNGYCFAHRIDVVK